MARGMLISFEGPEGSGKSTQCRRLAARLRRAGFRVTLVRDPGSTALGRSLRRVLLHSRQGLSAEAEAMLFFAGRAQLVAERIRPALARGEVVLTDRYHDSTVAYQGFGGGLDVKWLQTVGRQAIGGLMPDLTLLLDLPAEKGFGRLKRSRDRMERKAGGFHRRVRLGFRRLAAAEPARFAVVRADRPEGAVSLAVGEAVASRLRRRLDGLG